MRVGRKDNHAKFASALVLPWSSACSPRGEAHAGRATTRESGAEATTSRSRSRRTGMVSVKKRLGQRREIERVVRGLRGQRQVRQRPRAPLVIGWFSTGRSARGSRDTVAGRGGNDVSKPQPSTWRGVGEEESRPTAWDRARRALAAKTTTPSPPAPACSLGHRPVLHGAKLTRVARHERRTRRQRRFEAEAVELAWCR